MDRISILIQFLILFLYLLLGTFTFAQPEVQKAKQIAINDELYYNLIEENVYMITHYFPVWGGNSLVVLLEDNGAVLIDTPYEGIATTALLDWITDEFGNLELHAIVTGFHQDNLGGNEVLVKREIPVYGMKLTADLVETKREEFKGVLIESVKNHENKTYFQRYSDLHLTPPDHIFDLPTGESKLIEIGKEKFEFYFPGETHTVDNAVVYIHGKKILFGGCMIRALRDKRPGYIKYANMKEWPISVERVAKQFPSAQIVVPGHGFEGGSEMLQHTVTILDNWNNNNQ